MNKKLIIMIIVAIIVITGIVVILNFTKDSNKINTKRISCTYDGELVFKTEYINGQYTYTYTGKAWAVKLTDKNSTDPVTTKLCTDINGYPITEMSSMFAGSNATSIDLSSFNTSDVTNMFQMFSNTKVTTLNLKGFDTSKVTNMSNMFWETKLKNIDLSSFNTSNVKSMSYMFFGTEAETIDLSSFDFSNVKDLNSRVFPVTGNLKTVWVNSKNEVETLSSMSGLSSNINFKVK